MSVGYTLLFFIVIGCEPFPITNNNMVLGNGLTSLSKMRGLFKLFKKKELRTWKVLFFRFCCSLFFCTGDFCMFLKQTGIRKVGLSISVRLGQYFAVVRKLNWVRLRAGLIQRLGYVWMARYVYVYIVLDSVLSEISLNP